MSWIKIDDQFADHPKIVSVGPLAGWLHVVALTYCGRYLTDGFVPYAMIPRLADFSGISVCLGGAPGLFEAMEDVDNNQLVEHLLGAGLWVACDGGYEIHDYLEYNPSKEQVIATKEARTKAGRRGGLAKAKQNPSKPLAKLKQKSAPSPSPSIPTVAKKPAAKPRKPKEPNPDDPKTQMMTVFLKVTRLEMPTLKSEIGFWWSNMGELLKIANNDPVIGQGLIKETVAQMKEEQLTIASPKSLLNVARAIMAKRRRCKPDEIPDGRVEVMPL